MNTFRDVKPKIIEKRIKCAACGLLLVAEDIDKAIKQYHWHVIHNDIYCCPNCDITVIDTHNNHK